MSINTPELPTNLLKAGVDLKVDGLVGRLHEQIGRSLASLGGLYEANHHQIELSALIEPALRRGH